MKILTVLFLLIFSQSLWAQTFFYRSDVRAPTGPNGIFETGFHAWGENDNLLEHVQGDSLGQHGEESSAFVATSMNEYVAIDHALDELGDAYGEEGEGEGEEFYLYEIRPENNFYSVETSFREWASRDSGYVAPLNGLGYEREYAALGGIARELIYRATLYRIGEGNSYQQVEVMYNPYYVNEISEANSAPYPHMYPSSFHTQFSTAYSCAHNASSQSSRKREALADKFYEKMQKCNMLILAEAFVDGF